MNFEEYNSKEIPKTSEWWDPFMGDRWMLDNASEEAQAAGQAVELRLREEGWSDDEIGEFGAGVSQALKTIKNASVALNITKSKVEITIKREDQKNFDLKNLPDVAAEPESNTANSREMLSIILSSDGVDFNSDMIRMWKLRKVSSESIQ
jgi:hypothetical protein